MWSQEQIQRLTGLFGRYNAFPSGGREDEFVIVRENGKRQGIFKEWAPPVLPYLAGMEEEAWHKKAGTQPAFLAKELRRARRNSWVIDRDLTTRFAAEALPQDPSARVQELVWRLVLALGLMGPFYHLEALVDDPVQLGIGDKASSGGGLDVVALLLPSAFQRRVTSTAGNWNGLSWPAIKRSTASALASSAHAGVLLGLAGLLGVPPEHLIFAANALEWIPTRVGGKKGDVTEKEAISGLADIIGRSREGGNPNCLAVLASTNATIRFFNWLPLIEGQENFMGRKWTYASVCDTTDDLFDALDAHPELWCAEFRETYQTQLRPQLLNLDASSAKGRFLLDLIINERRLNGKFTRNKPVVKPWSLPSSRLIANATHQFHQADLIGTKPVGLALASRVLGSDYVLPGLVISMDSNESTCCNFCYERLITAARNQWPRVNSWVVRSSSMDEGTARGIYESVLRVSSSGLQEAIGICVRSYYGENAMAFRRATGLDGLSDRLEIAVLLQPYQTGICGGVATVTTLADDSRQYQISVAQTAEQVTSGGRTKEFKFQEGAPLVPEWNSLVIVLKRLHQVFQGSIQVEWVKTRTERIIILQMEFLPQRLKRDGDKVRHTEIVNIPITTLEDVGNAIDVVEALDSTTTVARLVIGSGIDPRTFNGTLAAAVVRLNRRVTEIYLEKPVSPSSHFASICGHFGIVFV